MVSSRQFPLLLSRDPVMQELARRLIAQRGVTTTPVVEHLDVVEQVRHRGGTRDVTGAVHPFVLQAIGEAFRRRVSQQFPLRLIEQVMPNSASLAWNTALAYCPDSTGRRNTV